MQVYNLSRSPRHSSFFPSGRTFQVISNRNFHPKENIFIRNEVNRHCLGYSSIDQLRHGPLRSNLNTARHRTVSVLSIARISRDRFLKVNRNLPNSRFSDFRTLLCFLFLSYIKLFGYILQMAHSRANTAVVYFRVRSPRQVTHLPRVWDLFLPGIDTR